MRFWPFRRRKRRERRDPFTLTDPWRSFVQDATRAQARFERVIAVVADGPLRERLHDIERRVEDGVAACWRIAQAGHALNKTRRQVGGTQSEAVARMRAREDETRDKLAALTRGLDEAVARAAEIATGQFAGLDAMASDVDHVVADLEALRQAIAEVSPT